MTMNNLIEFIAYLSIFVLTIIIITKQIILFNKVDMLAEQNKRLVNEVNYLKRKNYIKTLRILLVGEVEEMDDVITQYINLDMGYVRITKIKTKVDHGREVIYKGSIYHRLDNNGYETDYYIYKWKELV